MRERGIVVTTNEVDRIQGNAAVVAAERRLGPVETMLLGNKTGEIIEAQAVT
jgi:hypothetical protein